MNRDTTAHTLAAPLEVCRWQKNKWTELKPPLPSVTGATEVRVDELQVSADGKSVHVLGTVLFGVSSGRASMEFCIKPSCWAAPTVGGCQPRPWLAGSTWAGPGAQLLADLVAYMPAAGVKRAC